MMRNLKTQVLFIFKLICGRVQLYTQDDYIPYENGGICYNINKPISTYRISKAIFTK